jgi:hypothetical protein
VVQGLEDDRRPVLELGQDAVDVDRPAEGDRAPTEVDRVRGGLEYCALPDEPERGEADRARADQPLDVLGREQVAEASRLLPVDDERLLLPVAGEEVLASTGSTQRASASALRVRAVGVGIGAVGVAVGRVGLVVLVGVGDREP